MFGGSSVAAIAVPLRPSDGADGAAPGALRRRRRRRPRRCRRVARLGVGSSRRRRCRRRRRPRCRRCFGGLGVFGRSLGRGCFGARLLSGLRSAAPGRPLGALGGVEPSSDSAPSADSAGARRTSATVPSGFAPPPPPRPRRPRRRRRRAAPAASSLACLADVLGLGGEVFGVLGDGDVRPRRRVSRRRSAGSGAWNSTAAARHRRRVAACWRGHGLDAGRRRRPRRGRRSLGAVPGRPRAPGRRRSASSADGRGLGAPSPRSVDAARRAPCWWCRVPWRSAEMRIRLGGAALAGGGLRRWCRLSCRCRAFARLLRSDLRARSVGDVTRPRGGGCGGSRGRLSAGSARPRSLRRAAR